MPRHHALCWLALTWAEASNAIDDMLADLENARDMPAALAALGAIRKAQQDIARAVVIVDAAVSGMIPPARRKEVGRA